MTDRISGLNQISGQYTGVMCDVWGVLHNGEVIYPEAAKALRAFREAGGHVVMITNSPRPRQGVEEQLATLGLEEGVYDAVVTSGDVTRTLISQAAGPVFLLGPERDQPLFAGLDVELASLEEAKTIVCTGLFEDETEEPEDYRERLMEAVARGLPFICANPDIVVERGDRLIWCAGSLARLYAELGGKTLLAGKPHKPIYDLAHSTMNEISGQTLSKQQIIAVGDGMPTDVAGAQDNGFDLLYISAGIHSVDYGDPDAPDEQALAQFLKTNNATPTVWMPRLVW